MLPTLMNERSMQMAFNPMKEKGIDIEKQFKNWAELNVKPYNKDEVHPYTKTRIILMNGIEVDAAMFLHHFARNTTDAELKKKLAMGRCIEQQQQKMVNWFSPANESILEVTIGYEQVAVDLTAWLARNEPDPYIKSALDFALLEDFDHLYRYANLLEMDQGIKAEKLVGELTEIMPGRPTMAEHRHPHDNVRKPYNKNKADFKTKLHVATIIAAEQQTMNFYMNVGSIYPGDLGRGLYQEIAQIEEQHVSHYESLEDPESTWFERLLIREYNECYLYHSFMEQEVDPRFKQFWETCLMMEIEHLKIAGELLKQHEKREPEELLPKQMPDMLLFEPNKGYVREVMEKETELTADGTEFVPVSDLPENHRFFRFQEMVNEGVVPSTKVIRDRIKISSEDYRSETEGPHPVDALKSRDDVDESVARSRKKEYART
jgi:hypothetical protein